MIITLDDLSIALDKAPIGVLVLKEGRIAWLNETLVEMTQCPKGDFLGHPLSQTPLSLEHKDVLKLTTDAGNRQLQRQHTHVLEEGEVHYFVDITDHLQLRETAESLQSRLESLETTDAVTGLHNRRSILQELDRQISRSRRYENPLSIIRLSIDSNMEIKKRHALFRTISQMLKDKLRWADEIGMLDEHTFLLILPETALDDAKELAVKLLSDRATFDFQDDEGKVRYGVAAWNKGDDLSKLLRRVEKDQEINLSALLS